MSSVDRRALPTASLLGVAALAAAALLTACDAGDDPADDPPAGEQLDAEVVALENSDSADDAEVPRGAPPAIAETPIDIAVVAGWEAAGARDGDDEPRDPATVDLPEPSEGMSYVSWVGDTGCHSATEASLWRDGDDLKVDIEAPGDPDIACEVANRAYTQFEVATAELDGVATVEGVEVADASGPGELIEAVDLGQAWQMPSDAPTEAALRLEDATAGEELSAAIADSDADNVSAATEALATEPEDDKDRYAFLLHGCASQDVTLVLAPQTISAELDNAAAQCEQQSFVLATFDIAQSLVDDEMTPMLYGRPA